MADVLLMSPSSLLMAPSINDPYGRSTSSVASGGSTDTVQHHQRRSFSNSSPSSFGSYHISPFLTHHEFITAGPRPSLNQTLYNIRPLDHPNSTSTISSSGKSEPVESEDECEKMPFDCGPLHGEPTMEEDEEDVFTEPDARKLGDLTTSTTSINSEEPQAFQRWVSELRRRREKKTETVTPRGQRWQLDDFDARLPSPKHLYRTHSKSPSQSSSLRVVTAVKSATATLASASIATMSRRTWKWPHGYQRTSILSNSDTRPSGESQRSIVDEVAKQRSRKRRQKVEELIRSEESYLADLKALSTAYFTIVGNQHTSTSFARSSAHQTIADILLLHDDILGCLHAVVPFAEYDQTTSKVFGSSSKINHSRWHSVDGGVPKNTFSARAKLATIQQGRRSLNISRSDEEEMAILRCSPQVAESVAEVFASHVS